MSIKNKVTGELSSITTYDSSTGAIIDINAPGNVSAVGNISAAKFAGNGYMLTNLNLANAIGAYGDSNVSAYLAGGTNTANIITTGNLKVGATVNQLPNTIATFGGNLNTYVQVALQNINSGSDAASDFVATADNGSDSVNYIDMGIVSSNYDNLTPTNSLGNIIYGADSYLYAQGNLANPGITGGNLAIGTTVPGKAVRIFAGGNTSSNIIATVNSSGLAVTGNLAGTYLLGNGSFITGLPAGYSNADVATYLPTYTGNITGNNISLTGNTTADYFIGDGSLLENITEIANGLSSVSIPTANGAVLTSYNGTVVSNITLTDIAIGPEVHYNPATGSNSVTIGYSSGSRQGTQCIAIGYFAGQDSQLDYAIAIGSGAGGDTQKSDAIAIGRGAGYNVQGTEAIAIGAGAGGGDPGQVFDRQGTRAIAIGSGAGVDYQGNNAIAIGYLAGNSSQPANSIILNASGAAQNGTNAGFYVNPVRSDSGNTANAVFYNAATKEITYTAAYGNSNVAAYLPTNTANINANVITATLFSGNGSQLANLPIATIIGNGTSDIRIPSANGNITMKVNAASAFNLSATSVGLGVGAGGFAQGQFGIAIGENAGQNSQADAGIAIGAAAGQESQGTGAIAIGSSGTAGNTQGASAIAIGAGTAYENQGERAIAIGEQAAYDIQGADAIAIGSYSGYSIQSIGAVAIGNYAGHSAQGEYSIAIGTLAGNSSQANNSIILNASGAALNADESGLYASPVRNDNGNTANAVFFNVLTNELTYSTAYGNTDVAAYLPTYLPNNTSNISGNFITGNGLTVNGNASISGNLTVSGNVNYNNVTNLDVGDPLIYIGSNNVSNLVDLGIIGQYNTGNDLHTGLAWDHTVNTWKAFTNLVTEPTTTIDWANATLSAFTAGNITGSYFIGDGGLLSNVQVGAGSTIVNGTSNVKIASANGGITMSVGGVTYANLTNSITLGAYVTNDTNIGANSIVIGAGAGFVTTSNAIVIGTQAGYSGTAGANAIILGTEAGAVAGTVEGIAIGARSVLNGQSVGGIAIGVNAATNQGSAQGANAIAIGRNAVTGGLFQPQGANSIAIGSNSGNGTGQSANSIIINATGAALGDAGGNSLVISPVRNVTGNIANALYYNAVTKEVSYAPATSWSTIINRVGQFGPSAISLGRWAGDSGQGTGAVSIGDNAAGAGSAQGIYAVAVGYLAGATAQSSSAVAVGPTAGQNNQGSSAVAIGDGAAGQTQGASAVAIGIQSGLNAQGAAAVAIGAFAGQNNQGVNSVAIGAFAANTSQANNSIIINASGNSVNPSNSGFYVNPVRNDTGNTTNAVYFNTSTKEVTYGPVAASYGNSNVSSYLASGTNTANVITTGNLSVGTTISSLPNTVASFGGNVDSYLQINLQNLSSGSNAESDIVITANNGNDTVNYINMGIVNSGYDNGTPTNSLGNIIYGGDGYVYAQGNIGNTTASGGNLAIGTTVAGKAVRIFAGGNTSSNIVATISNVGVSVAGNVTATYFIGDGGLLSNVQVTAGSTIVNGNSNVKVAANSSVTMAVAGSPAFTLGTTSVAIGTNAAISGQSTAAVALGFNAGYSSQGQNGIAIGQNSGEASQGAGSIAVGYYAGNSSQSTRAIAIGYTAGSVNQGSNGIAIGSSAAITGQGANSVAIGISAGSTSQSSSAIAIGGLAGTTSQGNSSIAIGLSAAGNTQNISSIAIGDRAAGNTTASQGAFAVAIGQQAGFTTQANSAVAIGRSAGLTSQGTLAVAIGQSAGGNVQSSQGIAIGSGAASDRQGGSAIAIGTGAGNSVQGTNSIAVGTNAGQASQGSQAIAIGVQAGNSSQADYTVAVGYLAGSNTQATYGVGIGYQSGQTTQGSAAVAVGVNAGQTSQGARAVAIGYAVAGNAQGGGSIAIGDQSAGNSSTSQGSQSVAIGYQSGYTSQGGTAVAIGRIAGTTSQGSSAVAIGSSAGSISQGTNSVAVGPNAGGNTQGTNSVAVGSGAGLTSQGSFAIAIGLQAGYTGQSTNSVAIGTYAANVSQGARSVAIGYDAGRVSQGGSSVAIGEDAANASQGLGGVAIGYQAGANTQGAAGIAIGTVAGSLTQGAQAIAIGNTAGANTQGANSIAMGFQSGQTTQGERAIAIGGVAGQTSQGINSIAIGYLAGNASQPANSIILNASGSAQNATNSGFYVNPVRNDTGNTTNTVYYNTTTKELTYGPGGGGSYGNTDVSTYLASGNNTANIATTGNLKVGTSITILPNTVASFGANVDSYAQINLQNLSNGANAEADIVITANNGSDTVNYINMGIVNSGYDNNTPTNSLGNIVYAADSYLYAQGNVGNASQSGGNLAIGVTTSGKLIKFFAGGNSSSSVVGVIGGNTVSFGANIPSQVANSIALNYGGTAVTASNPGFYANPIRNDAGNTANVMYYNSETKEITYAPAPASILSQANITGNITLSSNQAGCFLYSTTSAADTITVPTNSNVAFPVGTTLTIILQGTGSLILSPQANVSMYLGGNNISSSRTVSPYGIGTLLKVGQDTWFVNGTGVY